MKTNELTIMTREIVSDAQALFRKHVNMLDVRVNYACIFSHTDEEYSTLDALAQQLGKVVEATPTGSVYQIQPLDTVAGLLQLLKIRKPDSTRPERGDADFTVTDYSAFKVEYLGQPGFSLIERPDMEMMELVDPAFNVRAYFSHPTLLEQLSV
ncbi:MAG: hypothetical protein HY975_03040 [Candidatus Kerfeldbacteria bacterium]|nr:hypothetical protein [Candidatus Kerfeldbacteria bacterium]